MHELAEKSFFLYNCVFFFLFWQNPLAVESYVTCGSPNLVDYTFYEEDAMDYES